MSQPVYRKLPGAGGRDTGILTLGAHKCRLWLGEDHLLQADSVMGYREIYKRFYLKDIKAITVCKTDRRSKTNILLVVLCILLALGMAIDEIVVRVFFGVLLAFPLTGLIVNVAKGPTCKARLLTAANNWELPSLKRVRTALRTIEILTPVIRSAQADLGTSVSAEPRASSESITEIQPDAPERTEPSLPPSLTNPGETPGE